MVEWVGREGGGVGQREGGGQGCGEGNNILCVQEWFRTSKLCWTVTWSGAQQFGKSHC